MMPGTNAEIAPWVARTKAHSVPEPAAARRKMALSVLICLYSTPPRLRLAVLTFPRKHMENNDALIRRRHSLAHLLAIEVLKHDPKASLAIGPWIDDGFYYDFEFTPGLAPTPEDLAKFEEGMRASIAANPSFELLELSTQQANDMLVDQPYKLELVEDLVRKGEKLTAYKTGEFVDLCAGPHVASAGEIAPDSFKLDRVAGAYWRGDETRPMLTRIYGLAFMTKEELDAHLAQREEAKKRDHKVIGPQLGLFTTSQLVGAGLPLIAPRGMIVRQAVADYLWELHEPLGYSRVWTPHIAREALYETSGHAAKFGDELFRVHGKEDKFILKPMNCPHHMQIYAAGQFSYRDMPVRYFEPATVYRDEKSGQLGGLTRVRAITQDDGHLFCRKEQILGEARAIVGVIKRFYETMGMMDGYWVRLSLRGQDKSQYLGSDEVWALAEGALREVCETESLPFQPAEGEAAFYGPKLDFMFRDAIGREWQLATIQCDFNLPERFDLFFINEKGEKERPVVIHRAISGSLERFMGVVIEHFAGAFPLWLSPVQVAIVPVKDAHFPVAQKFAADMRAQGLRVEVDEGNDSFGKKIRNAKTMKVPYVIVVGDKEAEGQVTLEARGDRKIGPMPVAEAIALLAAEAKGRLLEPAA
jgi:threonyl-tRNA synthetase